MTSIQSKSILRNIFSITTGQAFSIVFNFLSITLAARYLGVDSFGKFSYLMAIVLILSKFIDFGFAPIVFRELSTNKKSFALLNTAIVIRGIFFFVVLLIFNAGLLLFSFNKIEIILSNILIFNTFLSTKFISFRELLDLPFKVNLTMHYPMMIMLIDNTILLLLVLAMPFVNGDITYFVTVYVLSNIPGFLLMLLLLKKKYNFKPEFNIQKVKWLFITSLPLYGFVLVDILYQQLELLFLNYFHGYYEVGIYSAGLRLVMPLLIFPSAIIHTVFPIITNNVSTNKKQNEIIVNTVFKILFFFSFILSVGVVFKASSIIELVFGTEYSEAAIPVAILFFAQIFVYYNFFCTNLTIIYNKQIWNIFFMIALLIGNTLLNIFLIPQFSFTGAGISKLIISLTGITITTGFIYKLGYKLYFIKGRQIIWAMLLITAAYGISFLGIFFYAVLYMLILVLLTLLSGFFSNEEILYIFRLIGKESWGNKINSLNLFK